MREINPYRVKETTLSLFYLLVGEIEYKKLLVVLECLKDRSFDSAGGVRVRSSLCLLRG